VLQAAKDVCLAAAHDVTRQRCVRIIEAASASSSLRDIASSAALTPGLLTMRSVRAVNAVLAALGRPAVGGLDAPSLKTAGFSAAEAKAAGCDWLTIKAAGFSAAEAKAAGCDLASARAAGYDHPSLKAAGFDLAAFRAAGYDWSTIRAARFSAAEAKAAGCDLASARAAGYDPPSLKAAGFDLAAFRAAGYDWSTIRAAGFSAAEAKAAGCDPASPLQRDGPYIYMSLHSHKVDDRTCVRDGYKPVHVPSGWEIAPGDADDIRVCAAHPWQSDFLVFSNGDLYGTAMCSDPSYIGATLNSSKNLNFFTPENREKIGRRLP
jgi:hypothetical protein